MFLRDYCVFLFADSIAPAALFGNLKTQLADFVVKFGASNCQVRRMSSVSHSPAALTGTSASDLLRSSSNGVSGIPLSTLGKARFSSKTRDFSVIAKIRKVKKHEYPWPDNPDPNVKGGVLTHLSPLKPLKDKPKPVTLDFEKPLVDLEKKIIDVIHFVLGEFECLVVRFISGSLTTVFYLLQVQKMANETGLDFTDQIKSLENKYKQV